jgi:putative acetyltransferase
MHSATVYREVRPEDNLALAGMIRQVFEEHEAPQHGTVYSDPTTDDLYALFRTPVLCSGWQKSEGNAEGCCGVYPTEGLEKGCAELVKYYLSRKNQGKGNRKDADDEDVHPVGQGTGL